MALQAITNSIVSFYYFLIDFFYSHLFYTHFKSFKYLLKIMQIMNNNADLLEIIIHF